MDADTCTERKCGVDSFLDEKNPRFASTLLSTARSTGKVGSVSRGFVLRC